MQNLDKVAYAAAGILIIVGLLWPTIFSGAGTEVLESLENQNEELSRYVNPIPEVDTAVTYDAVRLLHEFDSTTGIPEWSMYRKPAEVTIWRKKAEIPPEHTAGRVVRVETRRERGKGGHYVVRVRTGKVKVFKLVKVEVEASDGEGGWKTVGSGEVKPETESEVRIDDLTAGKGHKFRLRTSAKNGEGSGLSEQKSEESEIVVLPVDENWEITSISKQKIDSNDKYNPPNASLKRSFWDYDQGKERLERGFKLEDHGREWRTKGKKVCGTEYKIFRIGGFGAGETPWVKLRDPRDIDDKDKLPDITILKGQPNKEIDTSSWVAPEPSGSSGENAGTGDESMTDDTEDSGDSDSSDDDGGLFGED